MARQHAVKQPSLSVPGLRWPVLIVAMLWVTALAAANPTSVENQKPGDDGWKELVNEPFDASFDDVGYIKGYASSTSVAIGAPLTFYISVNNSAGSAYSLAVFRLGYYQGHGGRLMLKYPASGYATGVVQPPCQMNPGPPAGDGLVQCKWKPTYQFTIPADWVSGIYVAKLTLKNPTAKVPGYNYIVFAVRDDERHSDIIYQQPVATYEAYNRFGGSSLYGCYASACSAHRPAVKESFDRPYANDGLSSLFSWEQPLIYWLEEQGYDVNYSTDIDTHLRGDDLASRSRIFLTAGHAEYWSTPMYDAVEHARDRGMHLAFLGGNTLYWQARFESSPVTGAPARVIVVYRNRSADPVSDPALKTINWRNLGRPEQSLLGLQWGNGKAYSSAANALPWVVTDAGHWAYAGTGVTDGESINGIIGEEWDSVYPDRNGSIPDYVGQPGASAPGHTAAMPPYLTFDIIEHSDVPPSQASYLPPTYQLPLTTDAVIYQSLSGAYVFSAGSVMWGKLSQSSSIMQTVANNVLQKMLATEPQRRDISVVDAICNTVLLDDQL